MTTGAAQHPEHVSHRRVDLTTSPGSDNNPATTDSRNTPVQGHKSEVRSTTSTMSSAMTASSTTWGTGIWSDGPKSNRFGSRFDQTESALSSTTPIRSTAVNNVRGGSGAGLSTSDPWKTNAWNASNGLCPPTKDSLPQAQTTFHSRSGSAASLSLQNGLIKHNNSAFSTKSRPPTVDLTSTTSRALASSTTPPLSGGISGACEPPPNVYTKLDRHISAMPDSAVAWGGSSPTGDHKSSAPTPRGGRTRRPHNARPATNATFESSGSALPDWSSAAARPSSIDLRTESSSSPNTGTQRGLTDADLLQGFQILNVKGDTWSTTSRGFVEQSGSFASSLNMNLNDAQMLRSYTNTTQELYDHSTRMDSTKRVDSNLSIHGDGQGSSHPQLHASNTASRSRQQSLPMQSPSELRLRPAHGGGTSAMAAQENLGGYQGQQLWPSFSNQTFSPSQRMGPVVNPALYLDPRMQQYLPPQMRTVDPSLYNLYGWNDGIPSQSPSFMPWMSFDTGGADRPRLSGEPGANGVQSALLYEFKSNGKSKRYELKDIYDHIVEFSGDQYGSRFIQTKLESANSDEKARVFREIEPNAVQLTTDVFGNYVIQKFFEYGDQTHKKILANKMRGQVLSLSLQTYGCRVVQKALEHVLVDQQAVLVSELENQVLRCIKDQNGNHVIQKAIERCPAESITFIIIALQGHIQQLAMHPYGCRVIQRCLERFDVPSKNIILAELTDGIETMIQDTYGNYVVQHVVQHDTGQYRRHVLSMVRRRLESHSKHKFASNVVEKCLEWSDDAWRRDVVYALTHDNQLRGEGETLLVSLVKDQYGNYVVQKLLDTLSPRDYWQFRELLQPAMAYARRTGCGKQVTAIEAKMHRYPSPPASVPATLLPAAPPIPGSLLQSNSFTYPQPQKMPTHVKTHGPMFPHTLHPLTSSNFHNSHLAASSTLTFGNYFTTTTSSTGTTPPLPPLTSDTRSLQTYSARESVNGEAV